MQRGKEVQNPENPENEIETSADMMHQSQLNRNELNWRTSIFLCKPDSDLIKSNLIGSFSSSSLKCRSKNSALDFGLRNVIFLEGCATNLVKEGDAWKYFEGGGLFFFWGGGGGFLVKWRIE